jgi:membrane protease YdiL (CAAX protease family)
MMSPSEAQGRLEPVQLGLRVVVYLVLGFLALEIFGTVMPWLGGYFLGGLAASFCAALLANVLALRIFSAGRVADLGLWWNRASVDNLGLGVLAGIGAAVLVLGPPLLFGVAHIVGTPGEQPSLGAVLTVTIGLVAGAIGEQLMMWGYGFQILVASCGEWAIAIPVGVLFALLHGGNPGASWISLVNTTGFGILFGYAYFRSRDLWLPVGLHFGWNFTLPLFGVNVSGLKMKMTGHEMVWSSGALWSGGGYGPEASLLTSAVMIVLAILLWKAPVRRQWSPITDSPVPVETAEEQEPAG